ncbi:TIGR01458 family HAD-type hydrolase [Mangrovitalea sediminis]|uniref:TIGR01458 family HAD-type hydrolase n=1 Tax=Mangrovitalea sediminis TaxID=1982043 RepID=UPI0018E993C4|nr:TIGR01458 family HAD-type hydrolase [Mangrovitalea sediminis]
MIKGIHDRNVDAHPYRCLTHHSNQGRKVMPKGLLIDIAGVLYEGDQAVPGAVDTLEKIRRERIPFLLVTNTTRKTRHQLLDRLRALDFYLDEGRILSAVDATADYLRNNKLHPLLIVHPAIRGLFADLIDPIPNAVVLGDAGDNFDYDNLNRAFRLIMDGAPLIAMGDNRYFSDTDGRLSLDIGPFKAALERATGTQATVIGKPSATFFHSACKRLALPPEDVLMIGDDAQTDIAAAQAAGLQACLVKTGKYRPGDERHCPQAELAETFSDAVRGLVE